MKTMYALVRSDSCIATYNNWISTNAGSCSWDFHNMRRGYCMVITFEDEMDAVAFKLAFAEV